MRRTLSQSGLWTLPVAGLLILVSWLPLFFVKEPGTDPAAIARNFTDPIVLIIGPLGIIGMLCLLFGALAIYGWLADSPDSRPWAAVGMIGGVTAMALLIGIWTILSLADSILGDLYLAGHQGVGDAFNSMSGGHWSGRIKPFQAAIFLSGAVGTVGLTVALWRSRRVARWVAIVFGVAFALVVWASPPTLIGAVLLIVTGILIARNAAQPATRLRTEAREQPILQP